VVRRVTVVLVVLVDQAAERALAVHLQTPKELVLIQHPQILVAQEGLLGVVQVVVKILLQQPMVRLEVEALEHVMLGNPAIALMHRLQTQIIGGKGVLPEEV